MLYFYRLALAFLCFLGSAHALVPVQTTSAWQFGSGSGSAADPGAACAAGTAYVQSLQPTCTFYGAPCTWATSYSGGVCNAVRNGNTTYPISITTSASACPANSIPAGGSNCACAAGFIEKDGQCKEKKSDKCGDLEGQSLGLSRMEISVGVSSNGALAGMIGKPGTSCFPGGCTVTGSVSACISGGAGGAVCIMESPSFSGAACEEKEPEKGCPPGTTPSAYAAGVCIPDENKCPPGSSPSKYAKGVCIPDENPCPSGQSPSKYAQGVCLPNEDPNANGDKGEGNKNDCPKGYVPSKYVAGLCIPAATTTDKDGTTTCTTGAGAVCTTKKPNGTTEEKPKDQFCADNPDSPLCIKGEFSGTCGAGFRCEGDAIQCAMAKEQHQQNCKLFGEDKDANSLTNRALSGTDQNSADKLRENASQVSVGTFDSSGYGWSHACPADPSIALNFGGRQSEFSIPFSRICGPLSVLSLAGVGITLLGCLVWVLGGKNNRG